MATVGLYFAATLLCFAGAAFGRQKKKDGAVKKVPKKRRYPEGETSGCFSLENKTAVLFKTAEWWYNFLAQNT